ncbi:MAG: glycosyltransferase family 2 protein [Acidimicrobiales bacterium]
MDLAVGLVNAIALLMTASFVAYVGLIIIPYFRHEPLEPGDGSVYQWHLMIPCLNEERVIGTTVLRLLTKFPAAHVWCIDDDSSDGTLQIVSELSRRSHRVHLVSRRLPDAQLGKGPALNAGWRAIVDWLPAGVSQETVMIGVLDADGDLDPRCLDYIAGARFFADPRVSAVQIRVHVRNQGDADKSDRPGFRSRLLTRLQDLEFTGVIAAMQMLRRHVGSTGMGGNGQFTRLSALGAIAALRGQPWQDSLIEDFELGLHVLLTGGRTEYCHDTWVVQQGPATLRALVRQRSRWAQGVMQCFKYLPAVMKSPKLSTPAACEIGYFTILPWLQVLGSLVYLVATGILAYILLFQSGTPLRGAQNAVWLVPIFLVTGLTPLSVWGLIYRRRVAKELSFAKAVLLGLANWPYATYMQQAAAWWAFFRVLRSRRDWMKTERLGMGRVDLAGAPLDRRLVSARVRMGSRGSPGALPGPPATRATVSAARLTGHFRLGSGSAVAQDPWAARDPWAKLAGLALGDGEPATAVLRDGSPGDPRGREEVVEAVGSR